MKSSNLFSLFLIGLLFLSLSGIASYSATQEIQLGALLPLTGTASSNGIAGKAALELCMEDVNAYFARQNIDYRMTMTIMDTASDPSQALAAIKTLAAQGINAIVGPYTSSELAAIKDYVDQNGILVLSPSSSSVDLSVADNIYRLVPDDSVQGLAIAYYLQAKEIKSVIPVYMNDSFGNSLYKSAQTSAQTLGITYTNGIQFDPNTIDFNSIVQSLRSMIDQAILQTGSKDSVAVHLIAYDQTQEIFQSASSDPVLSSIQWIGNDGMAQNANILKDSIAASFAVKTDFICPIFNSDDTFDWLMPTYPGTQRFKRILFEKSGILGDNFAIYAYDAGYILAFTYYYGINSTNIDDIKNNFQTALHYFVGYSSQVILNAVGDRDFGAYGFYAISQKTDGSYFWKTMASFLFRGGQPLGDPPLNLGGFALPETISNFIIPAFVPLSGDLSMLGQSNLRAIQSAAEDFNFFLQSEGVSGELQINAIDTETDPDVTLTKLSELKNSNNSHIIIGPYDSSSVEAIMDYSQQNDFILISPSSNVTTFRGLDDNAFFLMLDNDMESDAIAHMFHVLNINAVIPVWRNDLYGNELKTLFTTKFQNLGGFVEDGVSYEANQTEFQSLIAELETKVNNTLNQFGQKHTGILLISYDEADKIFATVDSNSILNNVQWVGCDGNFRANSILANSQAASFAAKVKFLSPAVSPEFLVDYSYNPTKTFIRPDIEGVIDTYKTYGMAPNIYDYSSYDTLWLAAFAQMSSGIGNTNIPAMKDILITLSYFYYGLSTRVFITDTGDRVYGQFAFASIVPDQDTYTWKYVASYGNIPSMEDNFAWYDDSDYKEALSQSNLWELFE